MEETIPSIGAAGKFAGLVISGRGPGGYTDYPALRELEAA